ncbi:glycosyltransferase family 4 protein [Spirulina sp. CS-785/01]|uniref:glycosyltransferase family 4 protein n=1 Tax=Spirulina sp. CS-785/01 TaxID=3021716 RepID=UPI00232C0E52|nr:glycosyltransferase family 4 protein [Spirulina sp. CS-785/01]MDB9315919.1 glycosyltransferase family 4 protein [Spirulina sp. CS-785/01]
MHILSVHNYYQIRGGEDESCDSEIRLLRDNNHQVSVYHEHNDRIKKLSSLEAAQRTIWSQEAYRHIQQTLAEKSLDLIHVQNFFPLISPSIYYAVQESQTPIIQTLRNYRLLCPNGLFFRDGRVCEDCLGKPIPYPGVQHSCYRDNRAASATTALMLTVHRLLNTWSDRVNLYIALTQFARQKFIEGGLPADKIVVKPNFVAPDPGMGTGKGGYAIYVGRLSVEKGLDTLLAAWERLKTPYPLKIVGDGPLSEVVKDAETRVAGVEWVGRRPLEEVHQLMGEATMLIFPSKWYETFGRVAVEAFAKGTPVIAANIGAIAELVQDGDTGLHFRPGDAEDLASKVDTLLSNPQQLGKMRETVRAEYEQKYTAQQNYHRLMEIYQQARDNG